MNINGDLTIKYLADDLIFVYGHDALQQRRLRVWVIKRKRKWDKQVMNVNYCDKPPPLIIFKQNNCYKDLEYIDNLTNCKNWWTSKRTNSYKYHRY